MKYPYYLFGCLVLAFALLPANKPLYGSQQSQALNNETSGTNPTSEDVNNLYRKGMDLLRAKQYTKALQQFRLLEQSAPKLPQGTAGEGIALALMGKPQAAIAALKKSLAIDPSFWVAQRELGILYWHLNMKDQAAQELRPLARMFPNDAAVNLTLAQYDFEREHYAEALDLFSKVPAQVASEARLSLMEATAYLKTGKNKQVSEILQRLTVRPDLTIEERLQLAWLLGEVQDYKAAIRIFSSLPPNIPDKFHRDYGLALAYFEDGQYANSASTLKDLEGQGDMPPEAYSLLGVAEEKSGHTKEAYDSFRKGILTYPDKAQNYLNIAALSCQHLNYDLAVQLLTSGIQRIPGSHELVLSRGIAYTLAANFAAAEKDLNHAIIMDPQDPQGYFSLGLCLLEEGDLSKALQAFHQASERSPDDMWPHFYVAETLIQKGVEPGTPAFQQASQAVERAITLDPQFAYAYRDRAKLELEMRQTDQAVSDLEKAHGLSPQTNSITYMLAQAYMRIGKAASARKLFAEVNQKREEQSKGLRRFTLTRALVVISNRKE